MGQANNRGTFEQRQATAFARIEQQYEDDKALNELEQKSDEIRQRAVAEGVKHSLAIRDKQNNPLFTADYSFIPMHARTAVLEDTA